MILRPNDRSCAWTAVKTFFNFESRQVAFKDRRVSFPEARLRPSSQNFGQNESQGIQNPRPSPWGLLGPCEMGS